MCGCVESVEYRVKLNRISKYRYCFVLSTCEYTIDCGLEFGGFLVVCACCGA